MNDDGRVNSIDASLVLQLDAGRLAQLRNPASADTNRDGLVNSIDATVILQIDAGLLPRCLPAMMASADWSGTVRSWLSALW